MISKKITACFLCFIGLFAANVKSDCDRKSDKLRVEEASFKLERVDNQTDLVEHGWNLTAASKSDSTRTMRKNEVRKENEIMYNVAWTDYDVNYRVDVVIIDVYFDYEMGPQHYRYLGH